MIYVFSHHTSLEIYLDCSCIKSSFFFIAEEYSMIWMYHRFITTHPLKDIWVVFSFGLL